MEPQNNHSESFEKILPDLQRGGLEFILGVGIAIFTIENGPEILNHAKQNGNEYTVGLALIADAVGAVVSVSLMYIGARRILGYGPSYHDS